MRFHNIVYDIVELQVTRSDLRELRSFLTYISSSDFILLNYFAVNQSKGILNLVLSVHILNPL